MKYVIVGNSTAGISAAEVIRETESKAKITLVSDEPYHTYSRPLITYWLAGKVNDRRMYYKDAELKKLQVSEVLEKKAVKLDTGKKTLTLTGGRRLPYDRLLLATGGMPITPPIKGSEFDGVFSFTRWDDAKVVKEYLKKNKVKKVVVVGGGLIGLKTTEALVELGLNVTVLELSDRILSATFDKKASDVMLGYLKRKGVKILTENTTEEIIGENGKVAGVILKTGKKIECQMLILAIGVRPNIELTKGTKIKTDRGIIVNPHMQTSVSDVYAAGDVVEAKDNLVDASRTIAIWPLAVRQGRIAGLNMAGEKSEYAGGFPMNSVEIYGMPTISVGITDPKGKGYSTLKQFKADEEIYKKIVLKDGKIKGVIFVGDVERAGIFTGLIDSEVDVSKIKKHMLDDDFGLILLPGDYKKHLMDSRETNI